VNFSYNYFLFLSKKNISNLATLLMGIGIGKSPPVMSLYVGIENMLVGVYMCSLGGYFFVTYIFSSSCSYFLFLTSSTFYSLFASSSSIFFILLPFTSYQIIYPLNTSFIHPVFYFSHLLSFLFSF